MNSHTCLRGWLDQRLDAEASDFRERAANEIAAGPSHARFSALISQASRFAKHEGLGLSPEDLKQAEETLPGWNPERWTLLESLRVDLVLARSDWEQDTAVEALEEVFQYADMGELCALYRSLAHLPGPERFVWRAAEGCRTNIRAVFEADCCDTPFPVQHFDDVAWRQLVVKCLFVEAPLWRVFGLDTRLDAELARIAMDLAEERTSAGRQVYPELLLCLGEVSGERGLALMERSIEYQHSPALRAAAALAFARAGQTERLAALRQTESDSMVKDTMDAALGGDAAPGGAFSQSAFAEIASLTAAS